MEDSASVSGLIVSIAVTGASSSMNKKRSHCSACLYASAHPFGTWRVHNNLLMSLNAFSLQVGGVVAREVMSVMLLQPSNADLPIVVTLLGMVTEVRLLHCWNADL